MMSDVDNYAETVKTLIGVVLDQTFDIHRRAKQERASLYDSEYYNGEKEFSILGHVELWSDIVAGIGSSIMKRGCPQHPSDTISRLEQSNIFSRREFNDWFFASNENYPEMRSYVQLVDYLRKLSIDYLNHCEDKEGNTSKRGRMGGA